MRRAAFVAVCLLLPLAFVTGVPAIANATTYRIDYVCDLSQYNSELAGINNSGQVVGYIATRPGYNEYRSFVWQNGQLQNIGTLGGPSTMARAINNTGQVTGWSMAAGSNYERAMIWQYGHMQSIGNLGGENSFGADINNEGKVAGYSQLPGGSGHAYTWADGVTTDSGVVNQAMGINDLGEVVGYSNSRGYIWRSGGITSLGTLGNGDTCPCRINNRSQVVGESYTPSGYHAFLWQDGRMADLGAGNLSRSGAVDINENGLIVGNYGTGWADYHACMWQDGVLIDLTALLPVDSGWILTMATAVNDLGQIAGKGIYNGQYSGFLLTPVPEPSTAVALLSGLVSICGVRRRRRAADSHSYAAIS